MPIYPSLEDMEATELIKAQVAAFTPVPAPHLNQYPGHGYPSIQEPGAPSAPFGTGTVANRSPSTNMSYPSLQEFMGLELTEAMIRENMPEYLTVATRQPGSVVPVERNAGSGIVAPISGSNAVVKSMVTHGVRQCNVVKGQEGKVGLRVRAMNTGVFVCLVMDNTPAARAGLRFGDQILQIDGSDMAGMSVEKVHAIFKKKNPGESTKLAIRDRPFERTVTLVRDSLDHVGFQFKNGKIINIVKESSAARNGLLTDHNLLEVNGKNVIGLKDKEITKIITTLEGNALTVTIMPSFLYNHMVKEMDTSLFGKMDHSTPDF